MKCRDVVRQEHDKEHWWEDLLVIIETIAFIEQALLECKPMAADG